MINTMVQTLGSHLYTGSPGQQSGQQSSPAGHLYRPLGHCQLSGHVIQAKEATMTPPPRLPLMG